MKVAFLLIPLLCAPGRSPRQLGGPARARLARFAAAGGGKVPRREFKGPEWVFLRLDRDGDRAISRKEYDLFFKQADRNGDGKLNRGELRQGLRGARSSRDTAPQVGSPAPKVSAKSLTEDTVVDLSKVKRITCLIFGSYT